MEQMRQYGILYKKAKTDLKVSKNLLEDFNNGDDKLDKVARGNYTHSFSFSLPRMYIKK